MTGNSEEGLKSLKKTMAWRKSFGVNDSKDEDFPREIYQLGWLFSYGKDKEGRQVLHYRARIHKKSDLSQTLRQYFVHLVEKIDRQTSHQG